MKILESQLLSVLKKAGTSLIVTEEKGDIIFWNDGAIETFGYKEDEVLGTSVCRFFVDSGFVIPFLAMEPQPVRTVTSKTYGREGDFEGIRKNRTHFPCEIEVMCYSDDVTKRMVLLVYDQSHGIISFLKTVTKQLEKIDSRLDNLEDKISGSHP